MKPQFNCPSGGCCCPRESKSQQAILTLNGAQVAELANLAGERLKAVSEAAAKAAAAKNAANQPLWLAAETGIQSNIHLTEEGDVLVSSSFVQEVAGDTVVHGTILGIPCELHVQVAFEGEQVAITLHLTKPMEIGPFTMRFNLRGIVKDKNGQLIAATSITPAEWNLKNLNWLCVAKCGGQIILPTLLECLPSLAGGPGAYVACVVAKVGLKDAAEIAKCIAEKCH